MNFETGRTVTKSNGKESFETDPRGKAHFLAEEKK
jgi:hypothetical protein